MRQEVWNSTANDKDKRLDREDQGAENQGKQGAENRGDQGAENREGQNGDKKREKELEEKENEKLQEYGQMTLEGNEKQRKIELLSIIGEVEGHENLSGNAKTTKYDHVLPKLASLEDDDSVDGLLVLLNTSGGCGCGTCHCGDDCISDYTYGVTGAGGKPFHRGAFGSVHKLFFYCTYRDCDDSSGAYDRNGNRSIPDL